MLVFSFSFFCKTEDPSEPLQRTIRTRLAIYKDAFWTIKEIPKTEGSVRKKEKQSNKQMSKQVLEMFK